MKKPLKIALIALFILASLGVSYFASIHVPVTTKLDLNMFAGADVCDRGSFPFEWDEETEMYFLESHSLEKEQHVFRFSYETDTEMAGSFVMYDSDMEALGRSDITFLPGQSQLVFNLDPNTDYVRISAKATELFIKQAETTKTVGFNYRAASLVFLFLSGLLLLTLFHKTIRLKPETGFLLAAALIMLVMFICFPQSEEIVWDGAIHRQRADRVAGVVGGSEPGDYLGDAAITDVAYVPAAVGIRLTSLFTDDPSAQLLAARIVNALTYLAACYFAVKMAVRYQMVFAVTALLPTAMMLGNSVSYDLVVNGFLLLFFSLATGDILSPEKKLSMGRVTATMLSLFAACMAKAVYVPFTLLLLFMPRQKFCSKKQEAAFKLSVFLAFLAIAGTFLMPLFITKGGVGDTRGGNVDPGAQLAFILGDPLGYAAYLLRDIAGSFYFCMTDLGNRFAYVGLGTEASGLFIAALLGVVCLTDGAMGASCAPPMNWWRRLILFVLAFGAVALIRTALFIDFTEPGSSVIAGVQPRYFIPLVPAVLISLQPSLLMRKWDLRFLRSVIYALCMGINFYLIWFVLG